MSGLRYLKKKRGHFFFHFEKMFLFFFFLKLVDLVKPSAREHLSRRGEVKEKNHEEKPCFFLGGLKQRRERVVGPIVSVQCQNGPCLCTTCVVTSQLIASC